MRLKMWVAMVVLTAILVPRRNNLWAGLPSKNEAQQADPVDPASLAAPMGYLLHSQADEGQGASPRAEPYDPQPGDILLYDGLNKRHTLLLKLAGSGAPSHSAIVIRRPDGRPAILEIGPNSRPMAFTNATIVEVYPRLSSYPGIIMVRRPHVPLTEEQSAALTDFALAQEGKKFAVGRLVLQITPIRCRHGLRHWMFARTYLDRKRWICSENVVAAATMAGLLDPHSHPANTMYPRDLAYDERYDLSAIYQPPVWWSASCPGYEVAWPR